ncbi:unnamed protein product, partial [Scytosiphon promiscuus]
VRISAADVEEVETAARNLAVNALDQLKERFPDVGILERCALFDPQRFPTDEGDICDYGVDEITALGEHYGKQHGVVPPVVDRDDLCREWYHAKNIMFDRARKNLSEMFIDLYAEFWSKVRSSNEGSRFPNLYKLVKIYIVQPHSSIECERGFSAQNRIKSKARNLLQVDGLELLMRLSL